MLENYIASSFPDKMPTVGSFIHIKTGVTFFSEPRKVFANSMIPVWADDCFLVIGTHEEFVRVWNVDCKRWFADSWLLCGCFRYAVIAE